MEVKAIDISGTRNITRNKVYPVVSEGDTTYTICNDAGRESRYKKYHFGVVNAEAPEVHHIISSKYNISGDTFLLAKIPVRIGENTISFAALVNLSNGTVFENKLVQLENNNIIELTAERFSTNFGSATMIRD
jgi:hypothetical protein